MPEIPIYNRFPSRPTSAICFVHVDSRDAQLETGTWQFLKLWLDSHEGAYPDIAKWADDKVRPGIINGQRHALLLVKSEVDRLGNPIGMKLLGAGVRKSGPDAAKICHMDLLPEARRMGYGTYMLRNLVGFANTSQENLVLTMPESVWTEQMGFFKPLGFTEPRIHRRQYRNGNDELVFRTSVGHAYRALKTRVSFKSEKIRRSEAAAKSKPYPKT